MRRTLMVALGLSAVMLLAAPSHAAADTWFTFFGGTTTFSSGADGSHSQTAITYGGTLTIKKKFGVEADFGYSNDVGGTPDIKTDNVRTFVVNFIIDAGPRRGRLQPYVSGGGGLVALKVGSTVGVFRVGSNENDPVFDIGGGVLVGTGTALSLRGDVRYFRDLSGIPTSRTTTASLGFFRLTGGLTFGF